MPRLQGSLAALLLTISFTSYAAAPIFTFTPTTGLQNSSVQIVAGQTALVEYTVTNTDPRGETWGGLNASNTLPAGITLSTYNTCGNPITSLALGQSCLLSLLINSNLVQTPIPVNLPSITATIPRNNTLYAMPGLNVQIVSQPTPTMPTLLTPTNIALETDVAVPLTITNNSPAGTEPANYVTLNLPAAIANHVTVNREAACNNLAVNQACVFMLTADANTSLPANITVQASNTAAYSIVATASSASGNISLNSINFVNPGTVNLTLINNSTATATLDANALNFSGNTVPGITLPSVSACATIQPNQSCNLPIVATSDAYGNGILTVTYHYTDSTSPQTVSTTLTVQPVTVVINNNQLINLAPNSAALQTFPITFSPGFKWQTPQVSLSGSGQQPSYTTTCSGATVAPYSCVVNFTTSGITTATTGTLTATGSNLAGDATQTVGVATGLVTSLPEIVSPSATYTLTLTNNSSSSITVNSLTYPSSVVNVMSSADTCSGRVLAPLGGSNTCTVTLTPNFASYGSGNIIVTYTTAAGQQTLLVPEQVEPSTVTMVGERAGTGNPLTLSYNDADYVDVTNAGPFAVQIVGFTIGTVTPAESVAISYPTGNPCPSSGFLLPNADTPCKIEITTSPEVAQSSSTDLTLTALGMQNSSQNLAINISQFTQMVLAAGQYGIYASGNYNSPDFTHALITTNTEFQPQNVIGFTPTQQTGSTQIKWFAPTGNNGMFVSTAAIGVSDWVQATFPTNSFTLHFTNVPIATLSGGWLITAQASTSSINGIYYNTNADGSGQWQTDASTSNVTFDSLPVSTGSGWIAAANSGGGIYYNTNADGSGTWMQASGTTGLSFLSSPVSTGSGWIAAATSGRGIYYNTNADGSGTWTQASGTTGLSFLSSPVETSNHGWVAASSTGGIYYNTNADGSGTWQTDSSTSGVTFLSSPVETSAHGWVAASNTGGIYYNTNADGSGTWNAAVGDSTLSSASFNVTPVSIFAQASTGSGWLAASNSGLYYTSVADGSSGWTLISNTSNTYFSYAPVYIASDSGVTGGWFAVSGVGTYYNAKPNGSGAWTQVNNVSLNQIIVQPYPSSQHQQAAPGHHKKHTIWDDLVDWMK